MTGPTRLGWATIVVGLGVILVEIVGVYVALGNWTTSRAITYGGAAATALVVGGSFLAVVGRHGVGAGSTTDADDKSRFARLSELVVSVSVLTAVTVLLGSVGGLVLTIIATLGGPDPKTADGELLRDRLLSWVQRNREFMRHNGRGRLPLHP
ncbi:hypothetical protein GCM10009020_33380 [Natronoarchaeum mannanilyticum]|uniref:Uncharacterized protein n=1 Tax=Natronoarchaeum mannanilyticum TaxID=926360 RepID=A0AAV3TDV6_9EURY